MARLTRGSRPWAEGCQRSHPLSSGYSSDRPGPGPQPDDGPLLAGPVDAVRDDRRMDRQPRYDVVVVGGRVAGLLKRRAVREARPERAAWSTAPRSRAARCRRTSSAAAGWCGCSTLAGPLGAGGGAGCPTADTRVQLRRRARATQWSGRRRIPARPGSTCPCAGSSSTRRCRRAPRRAGVEALDLGCRQRARDRGRQGRRCHDGGRRDGRRRASWWERTAAVRRWRARSAPRTGSGTAAGAPSTTGTSEGSPGRTAGRPTVRSSRSLGTSWRTSSPATAA